MRKDSSSACAGSSTCELGEETFRLSGTPAKTGSPNTSSNSSRFRIRRSRCSKPNASAAPRSRPRIPATIAFRTVRGLVGSVGASASWTSSALPVWSEASRLSSSERRPRDLPTDPSRSLSESASSWSCTSRCASRILERSASRRKAMNCLAKVLAIRAANAGVCVRGRHEDDVRLPLACHFNIATNVRSGHLASKLARRSLGYSLERYQFEYVAASRLGSVDGGRTMVHEQPLNPAQDRGTAAMRTLCNASSTRAIRRWRPRPSRGGRGRSASSGGG